MKYTTSIRTSGSERTETYGFTAVSSVKKLDEAKNFFALIGLPTFLPIDLLFLDDELRLIAGLINPRLLYRLPEPQKKAIAYQNLRFWLHLGFKIVGFGSNAPLVLLSTSGYYVLLASFWRSYSITSSRIRAKLWVGSQPIALRNLEVSGTRRRISSKPGA